MEEKTEPMVATSEGDSSSEMESSEEEPITLRHPGLVLGLGITVQEM